MIRNYDKAIEYYDVAISLLQEQEQDARILSSIATINANKFVCYYYLCDIKLLKKILESLREQVEYINPEFAIDLFEAIYARLLDDSQKASRHIDAAVEKSLKDEDPLDNIDIYQLLCEFLFEYEYYDSLGKVLDIIEAGVEEELLPRIRMDFVKYRMYYYKQNNNLQGYENTVNEYLELYKRITEIYHDSINETLSLNLHIEKLKKKNATYKNDANKDHMTKIYNRHGFEGNTNKLLAEAQKEGLDIASLLNRADDNLYMTKANGKNGYTI